MTEEADFQRGLMIQLSTLIDGMKVLNGHVAGNLERIGRFDAEFIKLSRQGIQVRSDILDIKSIFSQFRSDVSQILAELTEFRVEFTQHRSEFSQHRSDFSQLRSELTQFRTEIATQLKALLLRMDEIENVVDGNSRDIKELRSELVSRYNDILTALQDGLSNRIASRELWERVDELWRRRDLMPGRPAPSVSGDPQGRNG